MNQTISGPQFAGLFWRDAFDFFVASDKVTAICVANLMGDEGDIVVGKKQHVFKSRSKRMNRSHKRPGLFQAGAKFFLIVSFLQLGGGVDEYFKQPESPAKQPAK